MATIYKWRTFTGKEGNSAHFLAYWNDFRDSWIISQIVSFCVVEDVHIKGIVYSALVHEMNNDKFYRGVFASLPDAQSFCEGRLEAKLIESDPDKTGCHRVIAKPNVSFVW